jgi:putative aldouronate transport system substrate-binding protein
MKKNGMGLFAVPLILLLSFSACNRKSAAATASGTVGGSGSSGGATSGSGSSEGWFAGRDFGEHFDIEFADVMIDASRDYNNGDEFVKQWTSKFNIAYNLTPLTFENWAERLRVWINSGDAPDMFAWDYTHGEAIDYAEQGMVKKLPDNWKTKYPNLAKAQSNVPIAALDEETFNGTYYLFRPLYANNRPTKKLSNHVSLYVRNDWAKAVGVELKDAMTIEELIDFARKVKAADPGKVGSNFYPLVNRTGWISFIVGANNTYTGYNNNPPYYKGSDGQYRWGPADTSTLEVLRQLNTAWREGLLDPEFYNIQDPDDLGAFYTVGRAAAVVADGMAWRMTEFDQHLRRDQDINYDDVVKVVTVLGNDGYYHGQSLYNYWGVVAFSPNISDKKLDRILQMFDYSCTDEGQLILRCGIKDVDWELDAEGNVASKLPPGTSLWEQYAMLPVYVNMLILSDDFQFNDPNYKAEFRSRTKSLYSVRENNSTDETFPPEPDWNVTLHASRALNMASLNYSDEYSALIVKPGDVEANWRAWVNEKTPLIQPVLNELNAKQ